MEGMLCSNGLGGMAFQLQELQSRGSLNPTPIFLVRRRRLETAKTRVQIPRAEARGYNSSEYGGHGRVWVKDIDRRRRDAEDEYRSGGRSLQTSRDGEFQSKGGGSGESPDRRNSFVELASHVDTITSVQNPYVKHLVKLRQNTGYRNSAGCVLVVGSVPLREICEILTRENASLPIKVLLVLELTNPRSDLVSWAERVVYVSEPVMRKVAGVDSTEGLQGVGVLALPSSFCNLDGSGDTQTETWVSSPRRVLVLDGIQDPGNLGTLLRTAAAFAWDGVFMLPGGCDPFNEKALRASRGASFRLPIAAGRWSHLQSFANLHKMTLYAADPDEEEDLQPASTPHSTETIDTLDSKHKNASSVAIAASKEALCLILGSEGQGLSENAHRSCERVSIPMPGHFDSLNVAVAGGILLYLLNTKVPVLKVT